MTILHYTTLFFATCMLISASAAFYLGINNFSLLGGLKILLIIPAAEIAVCLAIIIIPLSVKYHIINTNTPLATRISLTSLASEIYNLVEFIVIMTFLLTQFRSLLYKYVSMFSMVIISSLAIYITIINFVRLQAFSYNYAITSITIIIALMFFFYESLSRNESFNIKENPIFFLSSGILIQFCVTTPTIIFLKIEHSTSTPICQIALMANYIAYSFYYFFIYRGISWQISLTKSPSLS